MSSVSKIGNICKVGGKLMKKTYVNKKYNNENFAKEGGLFTVPISFNRYVGNYSFLEADTEQLNLNEEDSHLNPVTILNELDQCRIEDNKLIQLKEQKVGFSTVKAEEGIPVNHKRAKKAERILPSSPFQGMFSMFGASVWWRLLVMLLCISYPVLSYRLCPVCPSSAGVQRRTTSWLGVHQNIPRCFQHVRQQPLYAASVDTDSLYAPIPRIPSLEKELRESLGHLINDTAMAPRPLDKASHRHGQHVVKEGLKYIPRNDTARNVVKSFTDRFHKRRENGDSEDKRVNCLTTLPGIPGSGKSTFLVNFPYSKEYHDYAEMRGETEGGLKQPIISVFTFNDLTGDDDFSIALRIIYGALKMSSNMTESWKDFYTRHADEPNMEVYNALTLLRKVFGEDRLIYIGIDELEKVGSFEEQKHILWRIGNILSDGRTDILVSSFSPAHIHELTMQFGRMIDYIPLTPLEATALSEEFHSCGSALVRQIQDDLKSSHYPTLDPLNERILRNLHHLATAHPHTAEHLKYAIESGEVYNAVKPLLIKPTPEGPYALLCKLSAMPVLQMFIKPHINEGEREYILSVNDRDITFGMNPTFQNMMNGARCTIFNQNEPAYSSYFRLTTTLAMFFKMLVEINHTDSKQLGPLSRAAQVLFPISDHDRFQPSELWERAHCLTVVSRVQYYLVNHRKLLDTWNIFGLTHKFGCPVRLQNNLDVVLAKTGDSFQWKPDSLYVAPPDHPGFDFMTCLEGENGEQVYTYEEISIPPRNPRSDTPTTEQLLADKLRLTLLDHLNRAQPTHLDLTDSLAALDNVYFVLSRYGSELEDDMAVLKSKVVRKLEGLRERASSDKERADLDLVLAFVERHWERHVAVQGTKEIVDSMVPVLQPLAQLVQAISDE